MMNRRTAAILAAIALACGCERGALAQATNAQLPSVEEQLAHPLSAIVQHGGVDSFIIITLTDGVPGCTIATGNYRGWQFQYTGPIPVETTLRPLLFSSHEALPVGAEKADWSMVNYLLNHPAGTPREIQRALWVLLGGRIPAAAENFFPLTSAVEAMVVDAVTHGDGFVPADGQVSAILLVTGQPAQWLVLEAKLPSSPASEGAFTDMMWEDLNGDTVWQPGEPVIHGTEIWLTDGAGRFVAAAVTGGDGFFVLPFRAVLPGAFRLFLPAYTNFANPCAGVGTLDGAGFTVPFGIGSDGMFFSVAAPTASVGDRVWADLNDNGRQDEGEPGLAGVLVQLSQNGTVVAQTDTDDSGMYRFTALPPGKYSIHVQVPAGFAMTRRAVGVGSEFDSDLDPLTGQIECELLAGRDDLSRDIGLVPVGTVSGRARIDSNRNGRVDAADRGLAGVIVTLLRADGVIVAQTTSSTDGSYSFSRLMPGTYRAQFTGPAGYQQATVPRSAGLVQRVTVSPTKPQISSIDSMWRKRSTIATGRVPTRTTLRSIVSR